MPRRHTVRSDEPNTAYYVHIEGNGGRALFFDDGDYRYFLQIFSRHLSTTVQRDTISRPYIHLTGAIDLLAYAVVADHIDMIVYQKEKGALVRLMRAVTASYSRYFNRKYQSSGTLFNGRYKSTSLTTDEQLIDSSRYVHRIPTDWTGYWYSSLPAYMNEVPTPEWMDTRRILDLFENDAIYKNFMYDDEDYTDTLEEISSVLPL